MAHTTAESAWSVVRCRDCNITETEFFEILLDRDCLLNFFYQHSVLTCHARCKCGSIMNPTEKSANHLVFHCERTSPSPENGRQCDTSFTILKGSFFEKSAITLEKVARLVMLYLCRPVPRHRFISAETNLDSHTLINWYSSIREVFIFWAGQQSSQIGGEGEVVEIEWRKGGRLKDSPWIFGGIQRSSGQFFVAPTEDRSSATFLHIFQEKIRSGTTVVSDCWKPNDYLDEEDVYDLTVNYSMHFEKPVADVQWWSKVRKLIPKSGRRKKYCLGYLCEALFMVRYPIHTQRFHSFWTTVAQMYPPVAHF
uniref:ISXO2-like transposase domain-containing protein n=1 Tax=Dendroctonus ponderosae TaxID=77166 RepID=A0AAR5PLX5_DENPD